MLKYFFLGVFAAAFAVPMMAEAGEKSRFSESTLALCPEEFAPHEAEWTAECLVNAIRAWNIGALSELAADPTAFECRRNRPCHENFVFGPTPWNGAPSDKRSLFDMVAMARTISVEYVQNADGSIEAIFYPGWTRGTQMEKPELSKIALVRVKGRGRTQDEERQLFEFSLNAIVRSPADQEQANSAKRASGQQSVARR